jgi:hypothetical protein
MVFHDHRNGFFDSINGLRGNSIASAAATTYAPAAETGFARKVRMFGHGFEQGIPVGSHQRTGKIAPLVRLNSHQTVRAIAVHQNNGNQKYDSMDFHNIKQ